MLERFTERARRVLVLATEEARSRRHETVGPEHLLMGILQAGGTSQFIPWSNLA
jgi:ATP-dependent Clp protease ATP-binding subunit ClpC